MRPHFLIIGAQKCGTTWLYQHLAAHPALFLPAGKDDEFFSYQPVPSLSVYEKKFIKASEGAVCGDGCASYLWSPHPSDCQPKDFNPTIPDTVRTALGSNCRLIVLLKDPVLRSLSAYLHHIAQGSLSPETALFDAPLPLGLIALSRYGWHLSHWLTVFPSSQILVAPDPGSIAPQELLRRVTTFLGVGDTPPDRDVEPVIYGGLPRCLDESGLWVSVESSNLATWKRLQSTHPVRECADGLEVRLISAQEIGRLEQELRLDTEGFAVLAETWGWDQPAFQRWRGWPGPVGMTGAFAQCTQQYDPHGATVLNTCRVIHSSEDPGCVVSARVSVDIILPVYRGLAETQRCLESVLAFPQCTAHDIVVINDCSPEPELTAWMRSLAVTGRITLLENPANVGFVSTVNRGMVLHPDRDVVLLNSDTEVHGDWLDRLHRYAQHEPQVGTVTPFSNNATICSYPRFIQPNPLPADWPLAALDRLCATLNPGQSVELPTAVGFCMYITRRCLDQVGYFDAVAFGRGYGEENDFSMRALELGFRHLLAADVFVQHWGGVSFGVEKTALGQAGQVALAQRHEHYDTLVSDHLIHDPARPLRRRLDLARLARSPRQRLLWIADQGDWELAAHLRQLAGLLETSCEVLRIRADSPGAVKLEWLRRGEEFSAWFPWPTAHAELLGLLRQLQIRRIHYHRLGRLDELLLRLPADLAVPYEASLHDYYAICPQADLARADGRYCGEPETAGCAACLAERPAPWGLDILAWRSRFQRLLAQAQRVIAPSHDVLARTRAYIPQAHYVYLPHPLASHQVVQSSVLHSDWGELKVLALGELTPATGLRVLQACAMAAQAQQLPLFFRVLGPALEEVGSERAESALSFAGSCALEQVAELIARERPDAFIFPAQVPLTACQALDVAQQTGLPIVAARLGVLIERLSDSAAARLVDWDAPPEVWNAALLEFWHEASSCDQEQKKAGDGR